MVSGAGQQQVRMDVQPSVRGAVAHAGKPHLPQAHLLQVHETHVRWQQNEVAVWR